MDSKTGRIYIGLFLVLCMSLTWFSCKPSVPKKFIQPKKMESILYDLSIAEEIAHYQNPDSLTPLSFRTAVFMKHGVSQSDFDSSMVYYTRHTKQLHDIYLNISERLSNEAIAQGVNATELNHFGEVASGDTATIWKGSSAIVLSPHISLNNYSFSFDADTAIHKGDRILLDFNAQFLYQDGMRDAIVLLAVQFMNDSVASQSVRLSSTSHYHLQLEDRDRIGIKAIKGYFMLNQPNESTSSRTTLRLLFITDIRMVHMHIEKAKTVSNGSAPAVVADSIRTDSAQRPKPPGMMTPQPVRSRRVLPPPPVKRMEPEKVKPVAKEV
ncbi:MAG: DUF4296 domain-containing protein [Prevotella sp.]